MRGGSAPARRYWEKTRTYCAVRAAPAQARPRRAVAHRRTAQASGTKRPIAGSMRHQHGQLRVGENVPRGAAEDHLAQAALRISALDDEVAAELLGLGQDSFAGAALAGGLHRYGRGGNAVHLERTGHLLPARP